MAMVVKNNMSAVRTLSTLNKNNTALQDSLSKVSSGLKINTAKDDASGYAISERMRVQIRSLDQATQNSQNASSLMKNAEGAVERTVEILRTLKQKAIDAATDTNTDDDRATIQKEIDQFIDQIDDNALVTFNGKYLLEGSRAQSGQEVATHMTNSSLSTDTNINTQLTQLRNRNGELIEINTGDRVTVSFVMGGKTYTSVMTSVKNSDRLGDIYDMLNTAVNGTTTASSAFAALDKKFSTQTTLSGSNTFSGFSIKADNKVGDVLASSNTFTVSTGGKQYEYKGLAKYVDIVPNSNPNSSTIALDLYGMIFRDLSDEKAEWTTYSFAIPDGGTSATAVSGTTVPTITSGTLTAALGDFNLEISVGTGTRVYQTVRFESGTMVSTTVTSQSFSISGTGTLTSFKAGSTILEDTVIGTTASGKVQNTRDGFNALTFMANKGGLEGQISGLSISVADSEGNVKKATNTALDAFKTTIYAANETADGSVSFQVGAAANQAIKVGLMDMRSEALGLKGRDGTTIQVTTRSAANAAVAAFDNAINKALDQQTTIGAISARLDYTASNLTTSSENVQAAESTIRDADMAKEMTNYTKNNVLLQAAQSMLAQANQNSSAVLSLLQ